MIGGKSNHPLNRAISIKDLNIDPRYGLIYEAIVKDVKDVTMHGRLRVWIPEISGAENDEAGWIYAYYSSPFAGSTNVSDNKNALENSDVTQSSYGLWAVPPDIGNMVLVVFASGRMDRCYWFSCVYQQYMNYSVPGISASSNNYKDSSKELPVSEYNKHDKSPNIKNPRRPAHKEKIKEIGKQGLLLDKIRGVSRSSARRETPSMVFGLSTPGPLSNTKGKRTGGHSIIMDDNKDNEHVTIETRQGSKIKLDDTNGLVYIINRDGTGWVEIDSDGKIMVFGASDFSVRAKGSINFYADKDINIEAKGDINFKSTNLHAESSENITSLSDKFVANVSTAFDINSNNTIDVRASSEISMDGSVFNAQSGMSNPDTVDELGTNSKVDILEEFSDANYYNRETEDIDTIVTTFPTFEPCKDHKAK